MSEDRDHVLDALFTESTEPLDDRAFLHEVTRHIESRRRRVPGGRLTVLVLLVALEVILDSPLQSSLGAAADLLGGDLLSIEHEWLAFVLAPINSAAGVLGALLLGLHYLYRKMLY